MAQYDVIVVGGGVAGLGVAGLLQKEGINTLVIEKSKRPGGRAKTYVMEGGWRLDSGTHAMNLGKLSPCNKILIKLGKKIKWSRPLEGGMIFSDGKWKSFEEEMGLTEEDQKAFETIGERILNMTDQEIEALDTVSLFDWTKDNIENPKVIELFNNLGQMQTTLTDANLISAGEFAWIFRNQLKYNVGDEGKVRGPLGGVGVLTNAMASAVVDLGGVIEYGQPARKIEFDDNGLKTVVTDTGRFSTQNLVLAMPLWHLVKLLDMDDDSSPIPRSWRERINSLAEETSSTMGFTLLVKKVLFDKPVYLANWRIPGLDLPMQIYIPTNFDDTLAPPGHMIAFIGACLTLEQAKDEVFCKKTLDIFWEKCQEMLPGLEENVLFRADGKTTGIDGLSRSPGLTGKHRPKVYMPEVPGLYFAGDCFTGRGVGMESAGNSAIICADKILEDMGKS